MKRILKMCILYFILFLFLILIILFFVAKSNFGDFPSKKEREIYNTLSYFKNDRFYGPEEPVYYLEKVNKFGLLAFFFKSKNAPKEELPTVKPVFSKVPQDFAIYWLGHSSTILELDGKRIIIDPVFDNAGPLPFITQRYVKSPINREDLPKIDYVIITHNHYDHLEKKTVKSIKDTHFIVPLGIGKTLRGWGISADRITEIGWNERFKKDDLLITALPGIHYSGRGLGDKNKTLWASYVIKSKSKNIFWSGDTGYGEQFKQFEKEYGSFDLAALEIDAWNEGWPNIHMFPSEVIQAGIDLKAKYILPIHWGVFDLSMHPWDESINMILEESKGKNLSVLSPKMGERVDDKNMTIDRWWKK